MFARKRKILKGNLAFMPLVLLLDALGFHLESAKTTMQKVCRAIHSTLVLLLLFVASQFIQYSVDSSVVVATIAYINTRCIYFTLIIIYIRSMIANKSWRRVFKCFENIDLRQQTALSVGIKDDNSKWFMRVMLLLVVISSFSSFVCESFNDKVFNVGQFVHAMLVFILSVKILFYCTLCASIKVRFGTLIKYLKDSKSSQSSMLVSRKCVAAKSIRDVSELKEISLIYDEVLEIISLLNESFSTLLSFAFGELPCSRGCGEGGMKYVNDVKTKAT